LTDAFTVSRTRPRISSAMLGRESRTSSANAHSHWFAQDPVQDAGGRVDSDQPVYVDDVAAALAILRQSQIIVWC